MKAEEPTGIGKITDWIEETTIALILGTMTLITFSNVVARYVFNSNILWALETTVFLFAWLVLLGTSYCIKKQAHIGVDVVLNMVSPGLKKIFAYLAITACLAFSVLLLIGSWEYWYPFITKRAYFETQDIKMPEFLQFLSILINEGERYEKLPRFIPYFALPLGLALITFRFLQVAWKIFTGQQDTIIASHEAEELLEAAGISKTEEKH